MGTLASCIAKAGKALSDENKAAILSADRANREAGMGAEAAARAAVQAQIDKVQAQVSTWTDAKPASLKERAAAMAAKGEPVHQDPGEAPEVATKAVVAEAIKTAAGNRDRKPSEMKRELLRMIDEAIPAAKDRTDQDVQVYESTAPGVRMTDAEQAEYKRLSGTQRDKYMKRLAEDKAGLHQRAAERIGFVTLKVPGDGTFKILNTVDRLQAFRAKVDRSPGFSAIGRAAPKPERVNGYGMRKDPGSPFGVESGSGGPKAVIENMIDEGDPQAAVDYAAARGLVIADVLKGDKARLPKVAGLTPTTDEGPVGEFEPEVAETEQAAAPSASVDAQPAATTAASAPAPSPAPAAPNPNRTLTRAEYEAAVAERTSEFAISLAGDNVPVSFTQRKMADERIPARLKERFDILATGAGAAKRYWVVPTYTEYLRRRGETEQATPAAQPVAEPPAQAPAEAAESTAPAPDEPGINDRDHFTLKRLNRDTDAMEPVTFARGEYVTYKVGDGGKQAFGEIDGISHAKRQFSVDGLWHDFGFAYKAERPDAPKKNTVPLSSVVDKVNAKFGAGLGPADAVSVFEAFKGTMRAVYDGTASVDDYKAAYRRVRDAEAVKAELGKLTKDDLIRTFGIVREGKKDELIEIAYNSMLRGFALGKSYGPQWMTMGQEAAYERQKSAALDAIVENHTAEDLAAYAAQVKAEREAEAAKRAAAAEAIKSPKTLDEYRRFMSYHTRDGKSTTEVRLSMLTPEQRADFDLMLAEETRGRRKVTNDDQRTAVRVAGQTVDGNIIATKHTKKGHDLYVVQLAERVSREDYETLNTGAKKIGGYYSSFRGGGAIPGFQFTTREQAQAFVTLAGGDATAAKDAAEARRDAYADDRSQTAAERLTEMAEAMDAAADESMSRERKANTARRARFAAAAEAEAREAKAMAKTMRNVAEALTSGKAKFLDRIRTKTQVQLLQTYVANAKGDELRAKFPTYAEQEKRKGQPPTAETADYADFPTFTAYRSDLASLGRQLSEVDGTKKIGDQIMKVADDVTDAFTAWVKEPGNYLRVAAFSSKGTGERAGFTTKDAAERAIARSGYRGKAIPWSIKRGEWTVILSPSEAVARGLWTGDGDKRITLDATFGAELVEKIGRANRRGAKVSVPWQFERAHERRKQLQRMGIETPAEFRAALREFIGLREQAAEADRIKALERAMVGRRNDGLDFFPTPESVADEMVAAADIQPDMAVLEPSAGFGHIADRIRAAGAEPDVIELSADRRELLEAKGYHFAPVSDFLALKPREFFTFGDVFKAPDGRVGIMHGGRGWSGRASLHEVNSDGTEGRMIGWYDRDELVGVRHRGTDSGYDRILMNPPFSDGRDIEHVRHAYSLLKPGGRIVAIMGESAFTNQNKRATEFRDWLAQVGGTDEKLPEGTFNDPSLPVNTGANARMVVIEKGEQPLMSRAGLMSRQGLVESGTVSPRLLSAEVSKITANWDTDLATVKVVNTVEDLPEAIRQAVKNVGAENQVRGLAMPTGDVYLVAENIGSLDEGRFVLFHEVYGHVGMRAFLGDGYSLQMRTLKAANPSLAREADAWFKRYGEAEIQARIDAGMSPLKARQAVNDLAVEEALADRAGDAPAIKGWQRLVAAIQRALRRMGLGSVADMLEGMSEAETLALLVSAREVVRGRQEAMGQAAPALSRRPTTGSRGVFARFDQLGDALGSAKQGMADAASLLNLQSVGLVRDDELPADVPAAVNVQTGAVHWNPAATHSRGQWAQIMAEELLHAADVVGIGRAITASSSRLSVQGDIRREAQAVFEAGGPAAEWLSYPLHPAQGLSDARISAELFARLGTFYHGDPTRMQRELPTAYEAFNAIFSLRQVGPDQFVLGAVPGSRQDARSSLPVRASAPDVSRAQAGADAGNDARVARSGGTSLAQRRADQGLERLRDGIARTFDADRAGADVGARLESRQTDTKAFRDWFGDSKVVDAEGKPLVMYHGTRSDFSAFDLGKVGGRFSVSAGFYLTSRPETASLYADGLNNAATKWNPADKFTRPVEDGATVMPVYAALKNPLELTTQDFSAERMLDADDSAIVRKAKADGYDGIIVRRNKGDKFDGVTVVAFRPEQIKSALGNLGTFDPTNADIRFSRTALRDAIPPGVQDWLTDRTTSQRGFNRIWHRTVGTQLHKAKVNKEFGRAYYAVQDFMKDVSRMATLAAEKAPDMLPQIETLGDLGRLAPTLASPAAYKQRKADIKAASDALFDGTLRYTRDNEGRAVKVDPESDELGGLVWTPEELKARGLSDRAVKMYEQSRAAIEQSLDSMLAADLYRQVSVMDAELVARDPGDYNTLMDGLRRAAASDTPGDAVQALRGAIKDRLDDVQSALDGQPNQFTPGLMQRRQDLRKLQTMIGEKVQHIQDLKDAGYAPLMRFGPYAVDVVDKQGRRVFFGMYESQAAANMAARKFRDDGLTVTQSVMPQKQFEALQGVSPETAMLFAEMLGVEKNEAMQVWLKNAVAEQSALKRHIRRKGIEGFDEDGSRVLAAFITSNARAASRALHTQRITDAVENIRQGDVQDEARALAEYVSNPKEEAQAIRSLLFVQYIGGSIASAIVNLTQTAVQTFPFLSQYGGAGKAGARIGGAVKAALAGKIADDDLAAAVARAEKEGIIKPQEVFQLQAEASRNLGSNLYARSILSAWGSMFQLAEVFNRRVAFIAAYNTAKQEGIADPFKFAENAVDETQSVFNKGNRPNWARGAVGATIFTFKTFTIQYVEFLKRLATAGEPGSPERARGQKAAALALMSLVLLAGMKGLPFAEDAEDLIDTVAQALGYNWTTDAQIDKWLNDTMGEVWADIVQHGMSGVPGVPFDVSQRLGMANLLPGTGVLKQSETNKQNQVLEVFGVAGSAVRDATQGQFLPIAIRNLMIGLDTYETGLYRDRRGRAVTEADPVDAALKAIGLQPNIVARAQRDIGRQIELRSLYQAVKEEITDSWAQARFAGDTEGIERARASLKRWNDQNPEARIIILPRTIEQRVIQMRRSKAERTIANAPRPLRASTAEALE